MLVLDYPKEMKWVDPVIVVPGFHTGHLGFLPGTTVNVAILTPPNGRGRHSDQSHPEVVISQFESEIRRLAVLSVTLQDKIGVVERLTKAISSLDINVELQESTSIEHLNEHNVTLILNMESQGAREGARHTPRNLRTLYDCYRDILPIDDPEIVEVFETIVLHCFDILAWRQHDDRWMPAIEIHSLPRRGVARHDRTTIQRVGSSSHIRLPDEVVGALRNQMRASPDSDTLCYVFISDTEQRNLRIFFLPSDNRERLFHVAFYHDNVPGALATILGLVARAKFYIVSSLLRKHTPQRSVWEAVLQYRGDDEPRRSPGSVGRVSSQHELKWIAETIHAAIGSGPVSGVSCNIDLNVPRYPREPRSERTELVPVPIADGQVFSDPTVPSAPDLVIEAKEWLAMPKKPQHFAAMSDLLSRTEQRLQRTERPMIFLSYPSGRSRAEGHAILLRNALAPYFHITYYNLPDGELIVGEVTKRIADADFFIGIWHHEEKPDPTGMFQLSPWMPFEYGVALALGKPSVIIHSDKLPSYVWNRINAGISHPEYSDLYFGETVNTIVDYCRRNFRND